MAKKKEMNVGIAHSEKPRKTVLTINGTEITGTEFKLYLEWNEAVGRHFMKLDITGIDVASVNGVDTDA